MSKNTNNNTTNLMLVGFALLMPGILLAVVLDSGRILQIIGLILVIASGVVFGTFLRLQKDRKK